MNEKINTFNDRYNRHDDLTSFTIGIRDVDKAVYNYLNNKIHILDNATNTQVPVPAIFATSERWYFINVNKVYRDPQTNNIVCPLIAIRQKSINTKSDASLYNPLIANNTSLLTIPVKKKQYYNANPIEDNKSEIEFINIVVPRYVTITYEIVVWTAFTEQLNKIKEWLIYNNHVYVDNSIRFYMKIDNISNETSMEVENRRILSFNTTFEVNAYIIPRNEINKIDKVAYSPRKIIIDEYVLDKDNQIIETKESIQDDTNDILNVLYYLNSYIALVAEYVNDTTVKLSNTSLMTPPDNNLQDNNNVFIFINGLMQNSNIINKIEQVNNDIVVTLNIQVSSDDTVVLVGKFKKIF